MNTGYPPRPHHPAPVAAASTASHPRSASRRRPRALSPSRRAIARLLEDQPAPVSIFALSRAVGLHENTVREHLDGLIARGLVERIRANPTGRGRPAWLYRSARPSQVIEPVRVSTELSAAASATSDPIGSALASGRDWGLQEAAKRAGDPAAPARDQVIAVMTEMGFDPLAGEREVALTRCPTLQAAHDSNGVVCAVHEGFLRGFVEGVESAGAAEALSLAPFNSPRCCLVGLPSHN